MHTEAQQGFRRSEDIREERFSRWVDLAPRSDIVAFDLVVLGELAHVRWVSAAAPPRELVVDRESLLRFDAARDGVWAEA